LGKISAIRDPNQFSQKFFEFYKRYVITNEDNMFSCKSCGNLLDIKNYVSDSSSGKGTMTFYIKGLKQLSEMEEYEKYNKSIKNIDKLIERIGYISGLNQYVGNLPNVKFKRQAITKDIIDFILIHHKTLGSKDRLVRRKMQEHMINTYNISEDYASFFLFQLSNDIFLFSTKEVDKFKKLKYNNILMYIIMLIISDLDVSHIENLTYDKLCNYFFFERYGYSMFDGLMIKINDGEDLTPIKNYKLLCYTLYYFSCLLIKYKVWIYVDEKNDKLKFSTIDQKMIIHTFIQLINSVLEVNSRKEKHYLYEIFGSKFLMKLETLYINKDLLTKLEETKEKRIRIDKTTNKYVFITKDIPLFKLSGKFDFVDLPHNDFDYCLNIPKVDKINSKVFDYKIISQLSLFTNCPTGEFHNWSYKNNDTICNICGTSLNTIYDNNISKLNPDKILNAYYNYILTKIANTICITDSKDTDAF
jgi:hypothetical protein